MPSFGPGWVSAGSSVGRAAWVQGPAACRVGRWVPVQGWGVGVGGAVTSELLRALGSSGPCTLGAVPGRQVPGRGSRCRV